MQVSVTANITKFCIIYTIVYLKFLTTLEKLSMLY